MALYVQEIDDDRTMTRPDGQPIAHILVLDHAILSADNLDELVGGLIPGYIASPDRQALRTAFADIVSSQVQESENAHYQDEGLFNGFDFLPEELHAISEDRFVYRQPVDVDEWEFDLRLVLLASDYAPHTDLEPPTGNILFIDDSSDLSLLASLNRAGVVDWITTLSAPEN